MNWAVENDTFKKIFRFFNLFIINLYCRHMYYSISIEVASRSKENWKKRFLVYPLKESTVTKKFVWYKSP